MTRSTFRVRVEDLRFPPNVPAGIDLFGLVSTADAMRSTSDDPLPIRVVQETDGTWRILEGWQKDALAAIVAGRVDVLAERA